jgi:putative PIN family toxin of toxin-antitoxin system
MITAVLDTNVIVASAIGSAKSTGGRILDAYFDGKFRLAFSPATSDELLQVLSLPKIRARHHWSDDQILRFVLSLHVSAIIGTGQLKVSAKVTRDVTDTKFLALTAETRADFLITKDRRHLLRLRQIEKTRIVTPSQFLKELD